MHYALQCDQLAGVPHGVWPAGLQAAVCWEQQRWVVAHLPQVHQGPKGTPNSSPTTICTTT